MQLWQKILIGLVAGVAVGLAANLGDLDWLRSTLAAIEPIGTVFIRLIMMIVVPLVVASIILGTASLGDIRKLGRLGGKTVIYYLSTTAVAVVIGLVLSNVIRPGSRIDAATRDELAAGNAEQVANLTLTAEQPTFRSMVENLVPTNVVSAAAEGDLLPLIIFSLIFGAAITLIARDRRDHILGFFNAVNDTVMAAPYLHLQHRIKQESLC